ATAALFRCPRLVFPLAVGFLDDLRFDVDDFHMAFYVDRFEGVCLLDLLDSHLGCGALHTLATTATPLAASLSPALFARFDDLALVNDFGQNFFNRSFLAPLRARRTLAVRRLVRGLLDCPFRARAEFCLGYFLRAKLFIQ